MIIIYFFLLDAPASVLTAKKSFRIFAQKTQVESAFKLALLVCWKNHQNVSVA